MPLALRLFVHENKLVCCDLSQNKLDWYIVKWVSVDRCDIVPSASSCSDINITTVRQPLLELDGNKYPCIPSSFSSLRSYTFHGWGPLAGSESDLTSETRNRFRRSLKLLGRTIGPSYNTEKRGHGALRRAEFEPTIPMFERFMSGLYWILWIITSTTCCNR